MSVAHRAFELVDGRALPAHRAARRDLARVGRGATCAPGERAITLAALLHRDPAGVGVRRAADRALRPDASTRGCARLHEVTLPPLLHVLYRYGAAFSPHAQNCMLVLRDDVPVRLVVKDFVDDMMVSLATRCPSSRTCRPTCAPRSGDGVEAAILVQWIQGGLLVCVHRYLAEMLEDRLGYPEARVLGGGRARRRAPTRSASRRARGPLRAVRHGGAGVREAVPEPRADARARLRRRRRAAGRGGGRAGSPTRWRRHDACPSSPSTPSTSPRSTAGCGRARRCPSTTPSCCGRGCTSRTSSRSGRWTGRATGSATTSCARTRTRRARRCSGFVDDIAGRLHRGLRPGARRARRARAGAARRHRRARADRRRGAPRPLLASRSAAPSCASCSSARACCGSSASPTSATTSSSRCSRSSASAGRVRSTCPTSARRSWSASARTSSGSSGAPAARVGVSLALAGRRQALRRAARRSTASTSRSRRARCSRCSGPTARARRRSSRSPAGCSTPDAGTRRACAGGPGVAPQEIGVYPSLTVRENLRAFARAARACVARGGARAAARAVRADRARRPARGAAVGRRAAAAARGDRARQPAAARAARRADRGRRHADARARSWRRCATSPRDGTAVVYTTHYLPEVERSTPTSRCSRRAGSSRAAPVAELVARARRERARGHVRRRARRAPAGHVAARPRATT